MKPMQGLKVITLGWMGICLITLLGCASTQTALIKRQLTVESKLSDTIFLEPSTRDHPKVLVQIKNTSSHTDFDPRDHVRQALLNKGYQLTHQVDQADFILQANIRQVEAMDLRASQDVLERGFDGALVGGVLGWAATSGSSHEGTKIVGSLVGATVGFISDTLIKDKVFTVITDVQVSQRSAHPVSTASKSVLNQGHSTTVVQRTHQVGHWQKYQTRVISQANQVNLKYDNARGPLVQGVSQALSGIF